MKRYVVGLLTTFYLGLAIGYSYNVPISKNSIYKQNLNKDVSTNLKENKKDMSMLEDKVKSYEKQYDCQIAYSIVDLKNLYEYDYNATKSVTIASQIKPFIAICAYDKYVNTMDKIIERMILYKGGCSGSNGATNKLIKLLGQDNINKKLRQYGFKTRIIEAIPKGGRAYKNKTTTKDVVKLYKKLYYSMIGDNLSLTKLSMMLLCKRNKKSKKKGKIRHGKLIDFQIIHKTGYVGGASSDSGIVNASSPYILSVFVEKPELQDKKISNKKKNKFKKKADCMIRTISGITYKILNQR